MIGIYNLTMYGTHTTAGMKFNSFNFRLILIDLNLCQVVPDRFGESYLYVIKRS